MQDGFLLGVDIHAADDFPSDDVGYGFSNIGDVLSLGPLLFEKYVDASERIAEAAVENEQLVFTRPAEKRSAEEAAEMMDARPVLIAWRERVGTATFAPDTPPEDRATT